MKKIFSSKDFDLLFLLLIQNSSWFLNSASLKRGGIYKYQLIFFNDTYLIKIKEVQDLFNR